MSETRISKADLLWISKFIDNYEFNYVEYPELYSKDDEDDLKIVKQIVKEKLDETK